jgi:hypothetical protein
MSRRDLEEAVEEFREDNSQVRLLQTLKDLLVEEMEEFPTRDSDANEHKLNMLIRDLEENLDSIENEKLGDWDPAQG